MFTRTLALLCAWLALGCSPASAQSAEPEPPTIGAVFREVPSDLWRFLSWDTGIVLGIGGGAALVGHVWDDDLADEIETNVRLNDAMAGGKRRTARSPCRHSSASACTAPGGSRKKDGWPPPARTSCARRSSARPTCRRSSTPSGANGRTHRIHIRFRPVTPPARLRRRACCNGTTDGEVGVPATMVAAYVAASRVHDNRHYLSDVIFGSAMGIAGQRTVTLHAGRYGLSLAPSAGPRRAGLMVSVRPH